MWPSVYIAQFTSLAVIGGEMYAVGPVTHHTHTGPEALGAACLTVGPVSLHFINVGIATVDTVVK